MGRRLGSRDKTRTILFDCRFLFLSVPPQFVCVSVASNSKKLIFCSLGLSDEMGIDMVVLHLRSDATGALRDSVIPREPCTRKTYRYLPELYLGVSCLKRTLGRFLGVSQVIYGTRFAPLLSPFRTEARPFPHVSLIGSSITRKEPCEVKPSPTIRFRFSTGKVVLFYITLQ